MYNRIRDAVNVMPRFWPFQYPLPNAYFRPQVWETYLTQQLQRGVKCWRARPVHRVRGICYVRPVRRSRCLANHT